MRPSYAQTVTSIVKSRTDFKNSEMVLPPKCGKHARLNEVDE
jgi:hypothetical protein